MDFFKFVAAWGVTDYAGCVTIAQIVKMKFKCNTKIGEYEIVGFAPGKGDKAAIVKSSTNFRRAAMKAYPNLEGEQKEFIKAILQEYMTKGYKLPMLGKIDICSEEEKAAIKELLGE